MKPSQSPVVVGLKVEFCSYNREIVFFDGRIQKGKEFSTSASSPLCFLLNSAYYPLVGYKYRPLLDFCFRSSYSVRYRLGGGSDFALFCQIIWMPIVVGLIFYAEFENHTYFC